MKILIELKNISFAYKDGNNILNDLDISISSGDKIGLIAPNGSGKTTLLHLIMGLLDNMPQKGSIKIFDKNIQTEKDFALIRKKIGLLFQNADDQLFCPTVIEDLTFGPLNLGKSIKDAIKIAKSILKKLEIENLENELISNLSGGQKKLISIASTLCMQSEILLLDEPIVGLDKKSTAKVQKILQETDKSFILISHNLEFAKSVTNKIYTLKNGKIFTEKEVYPHIHPHFHPKDIIHNHIH